MWDIIFWIIVVVVLIGLVWYFLGQKKAPEKKTEIPGMPPEPPSETPSDWPPEV